MRVWKRLTLLEIFVAMSILIIAFLGLSSSILSSINLDKESEEMTIVALALREKMEEIRSAVRSPEAFESMYIDYGPGATKEFFPIYPKFGLAIEDNTTKMLLPAPYREGSPEGGDWKDVGRVTFVLSEQVTSPNIPMLLTPGPVPDQMFGGTFVGTSDISASIDFTSPDSYKLRYVIVSAVWMSPTTGRTRTLLFRTILGNRGL